MSRITEHATVIAGAIGISVLPSVAEMPRTTEVFAATMAAAAIWGFLYGLLSSKKRRKARGKSR